MNVTAILILLKRFAPWIAGVLIIVGIFAFGHQRGAAKWKAKHATAVNARDTAADTAKHNAGEVEKLRAAIERQNDAYAALEAEGHRRAAEVAEAHDAAMRRQATAYQRALEDAHRDTAGLRERLAELTVAEACHEAWVEVMR